MIPEIMDIKLAFGKVTAGLMYLSNHNKMEEVFLTFTTS